MTHTSAPITAQQIWYAVQRQLERERIRKRQLQRQRDILRVYIDHHSPVDSVQHQIRLSDVEEELRYLNELD